MPAHYGKTKRSEGIASLVWLVVLATANEGPACGEGVSAHGQPSLSRPLHTIVQVAARSDYVESQGRGARHETLALKTKLSRISNKPAAAPALLIEYRLRDDGLRMLLVGGMFALDWARWTVAGSPFFQQTRHGDGRWLYWVNLRRQLTPRHSLGVEVYGSVDAHRPSKWLLAYSGTVSKTLSVSFAVGSSVDSGPDLVTRAMVTWRLGELRR
jgi:hypothetical protein